MTKKPYSLIAVCAISIIISGIFCPLYPIFFDDKEIFKYIAMVMQKGGSIYKDVFDHKPPLIYFFNYINVQFGEWAFWAFDASLVLFASIKFYNLNRKYKVPYPFILPILFNLILRIFSISLGYGMTREYTTIFLLLGFCSILSRHKLKYLFIGILGALTFFMQQDQILPFIPFVLYALLSSESSRKEFISNSGKILVGILIITLPLFAYLAVKNDLNFFLQDAFMFNTNWYIVKTNRPGFIKEIIIIKNYLYSFKLDTAVVLTSVLCFISLIIGNTNRKLLLITIIGIPLSLISEFLSSALAMKYASCTYYLLPLAASLPIALFTVFAFTKSPVFRQPVNQAIFGVLLFFNLIMLDAEWFVNYHKYPQNSFANGLEMQYLEKERLSNYDLYVMNNSNYIYAYNKLKIIAPSPWIYHFFWTWYKDSGWDKDHKILQSIIYGLEIHHTKYIIDDTYGTRTFGSSPNTTIWHNYLTSTYVQIPNTLLWKRK